MQMYYAPQGPIQLYTHQQQGSYPQHGHSISSPATTQLTTSYCTPHISQQQQQPTQIFGPPLHLNHAKINPPQIVNRSWVRKDLTEMAYYRSHQHYGSTEGGTNPNAPPFQPRPPMYTNNQMPLQYASGAAQRAGVTGPQTWQADVYAPTFVPSFYMEINSMPAIAVKSTPPPSINYPEYITSFAGSSFLRALPPYPALQASATPETQSLMPATYQRYFSDLLFKELSAEIENVHQYDMFNVPLQAHDFSKSQFKLMVPGIREDCPMVSVGDMVHLRQIKTTGHNQYPPTGFTGLQYESYIYAVDRQVGSIILRVDSLILESGLFNVSFLFQEKLLGPQVRAVLDISKLLSYTPEKNDSTTGEKLTELSSKIIKPPDSQSSSLLSTSYARKMLFPEMSDGIIQTALSKGMFNQRWFDLELNFEQQKAVNAILEQDYGTIPYLISGPPGTGKTKTIVEAALQLIFAPAAQKHHIILCAPSNQAADTLAQRLIRHLAPRVLFRMNASSRSFATVPIELLTYCFVQNEYFGLPDWKNLMAYRVIVTTCRDCAMLVEARCTNRDLARWERVVTAGLKGDELPGLKDDMDVGEWVSSALVTGNDAKLHWTALLVDESAQGTEPDILIPLSVVAPPEECSQETPIFVMAGDQKQLGPRSASTLAPLETSLLERLFSRPLYSEHPLSRQGMAKLGGGNAPEWIIKTSAALLPYIRPPFTNLVRNYRSHSAILSVPSALFYHDTLVPEATDVNGVANWVGWKGRKWPVLFKLNGGQDELQEEGASFYNLREVTMACRTAQSIVTCGLLQPNEIAIMSPFREQIRRIRLNLRSPGYKLRGINVGPIEAYQGSEHKFVIICTTRTRERFLEQDLKKGMGIIYESKKFNVAMTRAKQGLVVIGNPYILQKDPYWQAFMAFCWRNGAIEKDPQEPDFQVSPRNDSQASTAVGTPNSLPHDRKGSVSSVPITWNAVSATLPSNSMITGTENVNTWQPSMEEQHLPQYLSRLEQSLLHKDRLGGWDGYVPRPLSGGFDEDDPMWTAGIAAEEALRGVDLDLLSPV